jgi:hypothetical protein
MGRVGRPGAGTALQVSSLLITLFHCAFNLLAVGRSLSTDELGWERYLVHTRRRGIAPENIVDLSLSRKLPIRQLLFSGDVLFLGASPKYGSPV